MNTPSYVRWPLAVVLVAHAAVHVLGFLWAFDLADFEEINAPSLFMTGAVPGDPAMVAFGVLWLVSMLALIAAGIGVAINTTWALPLAGVAAAVSIVPTVVWWTDAWIGALLSGAILVLVVFSIGSAGATESSMPESQSGRIGA